MLLRRYHNIPAKPEKKASPTVEKKPLTVEDIEEMSYLRLKQVAKDLSVETRGKDRETLRMDVLEAFNEG